jgi:hypothetical protein
VPTARTGAWSLGRIYARISALKRVEGARRVSDERRKLIYVAPELAKEVAGRARSAFAAGVNLLLPGPADVTNVRHVRGGDRNHMQADFALDLRGALARVPADRFERCACCPGAAAGAGDAR